MKRFTFSMLAFLFSIGTYAQSVTSKKEEVIQTVQRTTVQITIATAKYVTSSGAAVEPLNIMCKKEVEKNLAASKPEGTRVKLDTPCTWKHDPRGIWLLTSGQGSAIYEKVIGSTLASTKIAELESKLSQCQEKSPTVNTVMGAKSIPQAPSGKVLSTGSGESAK